MYEMNDIDCNSEKSYSEKKHTLPLYFCLILLALFSGIFVAVYYIQEGLPNYDPSNDRFDAPKAHQLMVQLVKLGPKVVGSVANEIEAVKIIEDEIETIILNKNKNLIIESDKQIGTGAYYLAFEPYGSINSYDGIINIIVKIAGEVDKSILINSHFDTVPLSPGASDDNVMTAAMIETLRVLSKSDKKPRYNLIFLFNGAEESGIQASHAFIAQHEWAKEVKVVINLEATGHGGKAMLFQTGPEQPWLLNYYSKVPYPQAQVAGEELFQANVIPSDTDFRVFRDFGNVIGYDMAFSRNGFRYHTQYDNEELDVGVFQHTGKNLLTLVESVAEAPEIDNISDGLNNPVYYDFLGLFLIYYDRTGEIIINTVAIIFALIIFSVDKSLKNLGYICMSIAGVFLGYILGIAFIFMIAAIIDASGYSMRWYNSMWLIIGLYCAPVVAFNFLAAILLNKFTKPAYFSLGMQSLFLLQINNLIWTILLIIGFSLGIRSVYIFLYSVLFSTLALAVIHIARLHTSRHAWKCIFLVANIIPTIFTIQIGIEVMNLFLPITGRSGDSSNPEITVGVLCAALTILSTCYYIPFIIGLRKNLYFILIFVLLFLIFLIMVFTSLTFPYSDVSRRPQRYTIFHTSRIVRNDKNEIVLKDAGFTFSNLDRNSPIYLEDYVNEIKYARPLGSDCDFALYCGIPTTNSRDIKNMYDTLWIQAGHPEAPITPLLLNYNIKIEADYVTYEFVIDGPDRMNVIMSPKSGVTLKEISLIDQVDLEQPLWNGRPTYYIAHTKGLNVGAFKFSVTFKTESNWADKPVLDIAIAGKNIHDVIQSEEYQAFLNQFPSWTNVQAYVGAYESWVLKRTK